MPKNQQTYKEHRTVPRLINTVFTRYIVHKKNKNSRSFDQEHYIETKRVEPIAEAREYYLF